MAKKSTHVAIGDFFAELTSSENVLYGKTPVLYIGLNGNSYLEIDMTPRKRKSYANRLRKLADLIEDIK